MSGNRTIEDAGSPSSHDPAVKARLKWFNGPKGFGFVVPEDETIDAFLHVTTLQRAGIQALGDGACLLCLIERGPKGAQVKEVVALLDGGTSPESLKLPAAREPKEHIIVIEGTVKWYKPEKGFGFVAADDGMKDVFIHKSCLDRHSLRALAPGMRLRMTIRVVPKGREVIDFSIIE